MAGVTGSVHVLGPSCVCVCPHHRQQEGSQGGWAAGVTGGSHPLTSVGSSPGTLCEQHVGIREGHVPRQPLRPVLLPARLRSHAHGHRRGPPPGEGAFPQRTGLSPLSSRSLDPWRISGSEFYLGFQECVYFLID